MNRVFIAFLVSLFSFSGLMSETVVTSNTVNIHSGASASADVLASVPAGTSLQTLDSVDGYGWVEVEYNGETGYVASYLLPKHRKISHTVATRHVSTVSCSSGSYSYSQPVWHRRTYHTTYGSDISDGFYRNSDGDLVPRPTTAAVSGSSPSAVCRDGTYSYSQHRRGTCSHHGGVARWY